MNQEAIVIYDVQNSVFKIFDIKTKGLKHTLKEQQIPGTVNGIALQGHTLTYIKGRNLIIHDLIEK